jgi:protein O-mannosyl-transferase
LSNTGEQKGLHELKEATESCGAASALMSPRLLGMVFAVFLVLSFALYHPALNAPMVYDSREWIAGKAHVFATHDPLQVMGIVPVRPLFMTSLYLNYLWDGMEPFWFRVTNATILALTGVAVAVFLLIVYEMPGARVAGSVASKRMVAVFVAACFVLHPLQRFVVLYVWQREALLACLFYYAALAAYLAVRSNRFQHASTGYTLTALLFLAGLLSKENVATLPLVFILAEATLLSQSLGQIARRAVAVAAICAPVFMVYVLITGSLYNKDTVHSSGALARLYDHYRGSGLSPLQVAFTECRVLFQYLYGVVAPFVSTLPFIRAQVVSTSLMEPPATAVALAGVFAMTGIGLGLMRKAPAISFGLLFFLIAIGPESTLIPTYLFFGYRPILPMLGMLLIMGWIILELTSRAQVRIRPSLFVPLVTAVLLVPLIGTIAITHGQARRWNPFTFWQDSYAQLPASPKNVERVAYLDIIAGLGGELISVGKYADAIHVLKRVEELPAEPSMTSNTGKPSPGQNSSQEGEAPDQGVPPYQSKIASVLINLGLAYKKSGNIPEAIRHYNRVLDMHPRSAEAHNNLANVWEESGDLNRALSTYDRAVNVVPLSPDLHFNYACALLKAGKTPEAIGQFQRAVALKPHYPQARANLGVALLHAGKPHEAVAYLQEALVSLKGNAELHNALGAALAEQGRTAEAAEQFRKALAIEPRHAGARENLRILMK